MTSFKKTIVVMSLACFISTGLFFAFPRQAKAQFVVSNPDIMGVMVKESVGKSIDIVIMETASMALVNAMNYFFQKLAYDAAVWVAAGGSGQKPLFDNKSPGEYFKNVASNTFGTFIDDISKMTQSKLGFDLCQPSLSVLLKIKIGLLRGYGPPQEPTCNFQKFVDNWDEFTGSFATGEVLKNVGVMFEPGQNDLSYTFELNTAMLARQDEVKYEKALELSNNKGWQDVKDVITGRIKTPAAVVKETFSENYTKGPSGQIQITNNAFAQAIAAGGKQVLGSAISMFANTLLSQTMEKLMGGFFLGDLLDDEDAKDSVLTGGASSAGPAVGRRKAQEVYGGFIKPSIGEVTNYDPLIEFTTCPTKETEKSINNCVLDNSFASAIRLASQGAPISIDEAIKQGYLDGNKPLISSKDSRNEEKDCYQKGYCYSNLVKLRKARILPVGFELAAEVGAEQGAPPKLDTIVKAFNDCDPNTNARSSKYPYCHLIDPNWVLRLPATQCKAQVYGPTLISTEGPKRAQECADPITCISEDENGKCVGGWGYCTKEKNIWKIPADKCPEQYNTCMAYKPRTSKTNVTENYLKNTVRFDSCVASNAGCRPYSVSKNSGVWSGLIGDEIFFNKDVEKCESKNAGCTELYSKDNGLAYNLIRDSSFEALVKGGTNDKDWTEIGGATNFDATGANAFDGSGAINPEESAAGYQTSYLIKMERNTAYAISIYAKHQNLADSGKAQVGVSLYTDPLGASTSHFDANNLVSTCNLVDANGDLFQSENPGSDYDRIFCAFLTPGITLYARVIVRPTDDEPFWFDAVQLEEGVQASSFLSQGYGTVDSVYMKTPPSYLGCDAENPESECSNYVNTCKETEVGCELYSPKDNSPAISGIATINDVCPKECAGYEAFRQKDTYFEKATTTFSYLIPSTARACTANDVGCDEFTNIETETKEYFSFLRQCIKPGEAEDATFYTWEGSDTVGYQLRSHKLKTGEPFVGEEAPVPEYIPGTDASVCDKTIFQAKIGDANYNPDCREFYNADGKVSYRLLSKTIISTDECAQYRKTESDEMNCENSGGQWNPQGEYCIYKGYKEESITCASSASGCRAYTGTSASNMRIVLQDDFESGSVSYWKGGTISSEALSAGGHSLKSLAVGGAATIIKEVDKLLGANSTYTLSFWVKAPAGGTLEARISNAVTGAETFSPAGDWKYFEMGQIQTGGSVAGTELRFSLSGGTGFYIDNIILKEVSQNLYLIKNSWTTPASCDQTLGGLYLPQAMLGCREYADSNKNTLYLKSFSSLCRDSAVGCKSFQNTYNSASDKNEIHNVICALPDKVITASEPCQYNGQTVCNVGQNNSICRFNITDNGVNLTPFSQSGYKDFDAFQDAVAAFTKSKNLISLVARDESTVEVPADKTVYLVEDKNKYCKNVDLGCAAMGQSELYKNARDASTVYYKNLPDNYSKLLCTTEAEGCESWTSTKGVDYFKVPEALCEYKEAGVTATGGWVKKGTTEACYSGFVKDSAYGIWRNADTGYDGSVGMCPASQSGCTELIDPLDTSSANPKGEPYYVIDNAKFQALENSQDCNGKVSLTEGCVLFNKTSDTALKWHALATYFKADQEEGLVAPVDQLAFCGIFPEIFGISIDPFKACTVNADCPAALTQVFPGVIAPVYTGLCEKLPKNANTILKVTRDRECGEWLACKSSYTAYDPITKKKKTVCAELGLCNEYRSVDGDASICANFIANNPDSGEVLNANNYSTRDISWLGMDYSGFSLGNQYPITDVLVGKFEDLTIKAYEDCKKTNGVWDTKTDSCTHFRLYASVNGINYNLDGTFFDRNQAEKAICRGYPEPDAPFPNSLGQYDLNGNLQSVESGFQNANLCDYGENCECDYTKLTYGNISNVEYTAYGNRSVASGICQGGSRDGLPCKPGVAYDENPGLACGKSTEGGTCLMLKRQDDVIGWQGYCLERDDTTPINGDKSQKACMTWLPQDIVPGGRDIYNQFASAGYVPPFGGGKYMCLMSEGNYNVFSDNPTTKYDYPLFFNKINWKQRDSGGNIINGQTDDTVPQEIKTWEDVIKATYLAGGDSGVPVGLSESYYEGLPLAAGYTPLYILGTPFYEHEIDLVKIKVISSSKDAGNYPVGAVFYIRPDQKTTNYMVGNSCDETTTNNCGGEAEGATTLSGGQRAKSIVEENVWYFRYDDGEQSGGAKRDYLNVDVFTMNDSDWSAYCANSDEEKQNSFHLKFTFDSKGKMIKAAVRNCDSNASAGARDFVTLSVVVRKREVCEKVVDIAAFKNQAYTNRLWAYNPVNIKPITSKPYGLPYHLDYEMQPFGTASSDFEPKDAAWYPYYTSGNPTFAGVPWGSDGAYSVTTVIKQSTGGTQTVSGPPQGITSQGGWQSGTPKESDNKLETIDFDPNTGFVASITMAKQYISNLFNKIYKVFKLDRIDLSKDAYSTIVNCEKSPDSDCQLDVASSIEDRYKYPQIFSFDPNSKLSNGQYELAEENRFLIDNKSSDINISGNQYLAAMRFYFWADTDHMPIKSIKVDWEGDGTYDLITTEGFYENHKPLCAKSNSEGATVCSKNVNTVCSSEAICPSVKSVKITQTYAIPSCNDPKTFIPELCGSPTITTSIVTESQTCNSAKTVTFGNSPDACDEAYFELQHIYTCASGSSCVYKPKVIIVDNWETDNTPDSEFMDSTLKGKFGPATGPTITLTAQ